MNFVQFSPNSLRFRDDFRKRSPFFSCLCKDHHSHRALICSTLMLNSFVDRPLSRSSPLSSVQFPSLYNFERYATLRLRTDDMFTAVEARKRSDFRKVVRNVDDISYNSTAC